MSKVLLVLATAAAVILVQATLAPATNLGVTPGQFNALKKRVSNLEGYVGLCLIEGKAVAAGQFPGYHYTFADGSQGETTALDRTAGTSDPPQFYLLALGDSTCTNATALHLRKLTLTRRTLNRIEADIAKR